MRILLALLMTAWAGGAFAAQPEGEGKRLLVGFRKGTQPEKKAEILKKFRMEGVEDIPTLDMQVVEAQQAGGKFSPSAMRMMSDPDVALIEEDFYINWLNEAMPSFQAMPMPSLIGVMQQLPKFEKQVQDQGEMPWGVVRVGAQDAWESSGAGAGVRVAVVDTGIDFNHPDLKPNYRGGYNAIDSDKEPMDDQGHGTHVAGTIAAVADGQGVVGVAPKASLYAVKVLDKNGGGRLSSIIKGLLWCGNNNIQVANMSLGSPVGSMFMRMAVSYAKSRGVVIVAAAGNSGGSVGYPAAYGATIAVAASDSDDAVAEFSSRGKEVDFIAPGVDVKSTLPGGQYGRYNGTSMATPHVAGLAALAIAQGHNGQEAVMSALKAASKPMDGLEPNTQGNGMISAGRISPAE